MEGVGVLVLGVELDDIIHPMIKNIFSHSTSSESGQDPFADRQSFLKNPNLLYMLLPLVFVLGLGAGFLIWGQKAARAGAIVAGEATRITGQQATQQAGQQATQTAVQKAFRRYDVPVDDDPILGAANAPITIIEFSDYQCPYCLQWHQQVLGRLREAYPDQVRIVYRDFPLTSIHPEAEPAAEAANCANEQGAFWQYHDKLFSGQYSLSTQTYQQYATDLGLDLVKFNDCINTHRFQAEVQADLDFAVNLGVRSTPTFFINGIAVVGAQPFDIFKQVIDKELAGEFPK